MESARKTRKTRKRCVVKWSLLVLFSATRGVLFAQDCFRPILQLLLLLPWPPNLSPSRQFVASRGGGASDRIFFEIENEAVFSIQCLETRRNIFQRCNENCESNCCKFLSEWGGTVAEWSKSLLLIEKISEQLKESSFAPALAIVKKVLSNPVSAFFKCNSHLNVNSLVGSKMENWWFIKSSFKLAVDISYLGPWKT